MKTPKFTLTPAIIEITLDRLDFEKIVAMMRLLNWKWAGKIPTVEEARKCAKETCLSLLRKGVLSSRRAGFHAITDHKKSSLYISFEFGQAEFPDADYGDVEE